MDRRDLEEILAPIERELQRIADALERTPHWFHCNVKQPPFDDDNKWASTEWPRGTETR